MNRKTQLVAVSLAVVALAFAAGRHFAPTADDVGSSEKSGGRKILHWVAPMDANYRRDEPGKSPMGMDLVPVYADQVDAKVGVVRIDPTVVNNLGVRTERAQRGPLSRRVETVGHISFDEDSVHHIHTRVDGWIETLGAKTSGERVKKGQLLFELYSPKLVSAQEEYLSALRGANVALRRASGNRLLALGVTESEIDKLWSERTVRQRVPVYAAQDGVITHLGVRHGMFVTPSTEVMAIASLDRVWVLAEVFERQATWVEPGQDAIVTLDSLPGTTLRGSVDYVYPELDPVTRTLKVRLRFDNADELLRPNMFANVLIHGNATGDIVHVSRQAVIRGARANRVVVALGDGRFQSRPVRVGIESGDRVAIRSGVSAGERVVTSAQFLIDSESNIASALDRLSPAGRDSDE